GEQFGLGREVVLHEPQRYPCLGGDGADGDRVQALAGGDGHHGVGELGASLGVVHGSGHGHLSRHHRQVSDTDVSDTTVSIWRWGVRRPGTDEETAVAPARAGALLTVVCAAQFMVVLDISVVNVALPSM